MIHTTTSHDEFVDPWTGYIWSTWLRESDDRHCIVARREDGANVGYVLYDRKTDHIAVHQFTAHGDVAASHLIKAMVHKLSSMVARLEVIVDAEGLLLITLKNHGFRAIELLEYPEGDCYRMAFGNQDQTRFRRQQRDTWRPENRISKFFPSDL